MWSRSRIFNPEGDTARRVGHAQKAEMGPKAHLETFATRHFGLSVDVDNSPAALRGSTSFFPYLFRAMTQMVASTRADHGPLATRGCMLGGATLSGVV